MSDSALDEAMGKKLDALKEKIDLAKLKETAIDTLETVLVGAESEDVRRKAAVDILNFSEKTKRESPVTEEQLGWLGRVILEAEEIRLSHEVCEK